MNNDNRAAVVVVLGTTQTLAWASSYYLPAMLAVPIARDLGIAVPLVFGAFSIALVVSAVLGPFGGRAIDRHGGRPVLIATNVVFALGLAWLSAANSIFELYASWLVLGVGMGTGLYEAAFSTLVRLYGRNSRGAITGITLIAGFASTVGWPLSAWLESRFGWRGACLTWAALHLTLGIGLNALLPRARTAEKPPPRAATSDGAADALPADSPRHATVMLAFVFAVTWFVSTAMAAHLPRLLEAAGASFTVAVACAALVGPAQVAARVLEFGAMRYIHPLRSAQLASLAHPAGALVLVFAGAPAAAVFTLLHGAGNGVLTIAKGTLPLIIFGAHGYGARQGLLTAPARVAQAFAPFIFGIFIDRWGAGALWLSGTLGVFAFAALIVLPRYVQVTAHAVQTR
jgi:MFS family permease